MSDSHILIISFKCDSRSWEFLLLLLWLTLCLIFLFPNHYKCCCAVQHIILFHINTYFDAWAPNISHIPWKTALLLSFNWGKQIYFINSCSNKVVVKLSFLTICCLTISISNISCNVVHHFDYSPYSYTLRIESYEFMC